MGAENGSVSTPIPPAPVVRKVPPPPPLPKDLLSYGQAAARVNRDATFVSRNVACGKLKNYGTRPNPGGGKPVQLVSLKAVLTLSDSSPRKPGLKGPREARAVARDTVTYAEAAKKIGCTPEWLRKLVKMGQLQKLGMQHGSGGPPRAVVSLEEARHAVARMEGTRGSRKAVKRKVPPPPPTKFRQVPYEPEKPAETRTRKAKGISTFIQGEIRDFAKHVMVDTLDASSMVLTARADGTYDIFVTPRAPALLTFTV